MNIRFSEVHWRDFFLLPQHMDCPIKATTLMGLEENLKELLLLYAEYTTQKCCTLAYVTLAILILLFLLFCYFNFCVTVLLKYICLCLWVSCVKTHDQNSFICMLPSDVCFLQLHQPVGMRSYNPSSSGFLERCFSSLTSEFSQTIKFMSQDSAQPLTATSSSFQHLPLQLLNIRYLHHPTAASTFGVRKAEPTGHMAGARVQE